MAHGSWLAAALEAVQLAADGVELGRGQREQPLDQRQQRVGVRVNVQAVGEVAGGIAARVAGPLARLIEGDPAAPQGGPLAAGMALRRGREESGGSRGRVGSVAAIWSLDEMDAGEAGERMRAMREERRVAAATPIARAAVQPAPVGRIADEVAGMDAVEARERLAAGVGEMHALAAFELREVRLAE